MNKRWSPISDEGKVYEMDRGVICIGKKAMQKGSLDRNTFHHAEATILLLMSLLPIANLNQEQQKEIEKMLSSYVGKPFEAGVLAADFSNILIQLEGNEVLLFLPKELNLYQLNRLLEVVSPRTNFHFSIYYQKEIVNNISYNDLLTILNAYKRKVLSTEHQENIRSVK